MKYHVQVNGRPKLVEVVERLGELVVSVDGQPLDVHYEEVDSLGQVLLLEGNRTFGVSIEGSSERASVVIAGHLYAVEIEDEREHAAHAADRAAAKGGGLVKSIMPGVVVKLMVKKGEQVTKGQPLLILEAMKMQNEILAPSEGTVAQVYVEERQAVGSGAKLVSLT